MKKLAVLFAALSMLTMVGCASIGSFGGKTEEVVDYPTLVEQANAAINKAKSVGSEWRDSRKILKKAAKAAKAGKMELAMKLAKKAKIQGELGYAQGVSQKNAGPWLF